jgi:haloalkane dehalogenase
MQVLRTPDERFAALPGYPFEPHYVQVPDGEGGALRMHYVDEGPREAETVLCLHGQPTWSYLYRKVIPVLVGAGLRVVAPDLVGFGRSDKPVDRDDYTFARHLEWTLAWLDAVGLDRVTLLGQDWGGLIGLRLVAEHPDRFARVVAANTGFPRAEGVDAASAAAMRTLYDEIAIPDVDALGPMFVTGDPGIAFVAWRKFCEEASPLPVGRVVASLRRAPTPPEVIAAYDAPFPDDRYKAGVRRFPGLVPIFPDDPQAAANQRAWKALCRFDRPFLTAFSDGDPATRDMGMSFREEIAGARGQQHVTIEGAGHFLQEDRGEALGAAVVRFVERTRGGCSDDSGR